MNLAILTNILQFLYGKTKQTRKGMPFPRKWGPFFTLITAMLLLMADLTRHLVNDDWGTSCTELPDGSSIRICSADGQCQDAGPKYYEYCKSVPMLNMYSSTGLGGLSAYGWLFTVVCTWAGFICLFIGLCWAINLPAKLAAQWRELRAATAPNGGARGARVRAGGGSGPEPLIGDRAV